MVTPYRGALVTHSDMKFFGNITYEGHGVRTIVDRDLHIITSLGIVVESEYYPEKCGYGHEYKKQHKIMERRRMLQALPFLVGRFKS